MKKNKSIYILGLLALIGGYFIFKKKSESSGILYVDKNKLQEPLDILNTIDTTTNGETVVQAPFNVIKATKHTWHGGVEGVGGINYEITPDKYIDGDVYLFTNNKEIILNKQIGGSLLYKGSTSLNNYSSLIKGTPIKVAIPEEFTSNDWNLQTDEAMIGYISNGAKQYFKIKLATIVSNPNDDKIPQSPISSDKLIESAIIL